MRLKNKFKIFVLFQVGFCFLSFPLLAHAAKKEKSRVRKDPVPIETRVAQATVIELSPVEVDGRLDEPLWKSAEVLTDFTQHEPVEGAPATEKTEVRILYSQDSLYIGVIAFDSEVDKIKSILARRDSRCPSDWIKIWIDSYHDSLTAFEFGVNPCGVKRDVYWSNDRRRDDDWDAVWDVEVSQNNEGWIAEFRIPFSQIRFPERESHTWGFQASRIIARKKETSYWHHVPKGVPRFVSLFGDLMGINNIPSPKKLQLLPYTLGKGAFQPAAEGNPYRTGSDYLAGLGLDLKYGVTSNLTLDATFNPDFGQVEADPAQVNLTAYETYFPEKRPFFIEGKNMLSFSLGSGHERESLFYSRRIGRIPQGSPSDAEYSDKPENTTILGAFKLTGKTAGGWSIGVMEALTNREQASVITWSGEETRQTVEPYTNYFLGRAEKEYREGRSAFGFIFTAVNRKIDDANLNFLRSAAYSGGFGFRHRWAQDRYEISGYFLGSHIRGSEESILKAQESSARYYQRPDADHLELDPTRTSLSGTTSNFSFSKIGGGHWRWNLGFRTRSPGFEINDMGYMRDADEISQHFWLSYREYKPGKIFRDYNISFTFWNNWDFAPTHTGQGISLRSHFEFLNYWSVSFDANRTQEHLSTSQLRGGPAVLMPGNWRIGGNLRTDYRKDFHFNLRGSISQADNGATTYSLSGGLNFRPSDRIDISLSPRFSDGYRRLQYLRRDTIDDQTHYILGRIDQTTVSLTLRLNYTLTPNLSIQLYTQPYVSAGKYSEFKEVIQPRAENYTDRWHVFSGSEVFFQDDYYHLLLPSSGGDEITLYNPDFNFRQFRSNLVLRWEYLPGSILYLVWTNGINDYSSDGNLSLGNDIRSLFNADSNNAFMVKISYWFNL
jgi:hypothetical protein